MTEKKKPKKQPNEMELTAMANKVTPGTSKYFPQFDITLHRPHKPGVDKVGDQPKKKKFKFVQK